MHFDTHKCFFSYIKVYYIGCYYFYYILTRYFVTCQHLQGMCDTKLAISNTGLQLKIFIHYPYALKMACIWASKTYVN